jgi:hypothetical protein
MRRLQKLSIAILFLGSAACSRSHSQMPPPETQPVELHSQAQTPFRFVVYGDTRFTDPADITAANPLARRALVQAIAEADPAFISISGDIAYNGEDTSDWKVWDRET